MEKKDKSLTSRSARTAHTVTYAESMLGSFRGSQMRVAQHKPSNSRHVLTNMCSYVLMPAKFYEVEQFRTKTGLIHVTVNCDSRHSSHSHTSF